MVCDYSIQVLKKLFWVYMLIRERVLKVGKFKNISNRWASVTVNFLMDLLLAIRKTE